MSSAEVHLAMEGYFLRRTKAQVLEELPPILVRDIRLELCDRQQAAYEEVWNSRCENIMPDGKDPMLPICSRS